MPHIIVNGYEEKRQIQQISIHAEVVFSKLIYADHNRFYYKLEELKEKIEKLIEEYFDGNSIDSDVLSNKEFNQMKRG